MAEPMDDRVYAEQVRLLYRLSRSGYVGTLVGASLTGFALWDVVSVVLLGVWLCLMYVVTGVRFLLHSVYQGLRPADAEAPRWAWRFMVGAGVTGLMWGVAGSVLYPAASLQHQFLVIFLIVGVTMVGMVLLAPVREAFFVFMLPALSLLCATVLMQGTMLHFFMGALIAVYLLLLFGVAPVLSAMMRDALRVRFENAALVEQLSGRVKAQQRAEDVLRMSEQRYRYMFEANPLPMWIRDERTLEILDVNAATLLDYGYTREEFLRLKASDLIAPEDAGRFLEKVRQRDPHGNYANDWRHRRRDGSIMEVETVSHACELDGRPARLTLVNDVTERRRAERRLQMEHAITRILADARSVGEALPQILRAICESGGWVYGQCWEVDRNADRMRCAETWHAADAGLAAFETYNRPLALEPGASRGPINRVWKNNDPVWIADLASVEREMIRGPAALRAGLRSAFAVPIMIGDTFYGLLEFFGREPRQPDPALVEALRTIGSQIGQFMGRKSAEQNLRFVASHDALTGLFNRNMFNERLQQALSRAARFGRGLSLLFMDLDGFKSINDTLGHNAGDALLAELAGRLRASLREGDVIGRMGGDEFVVLIEESSEATQTAEVAKKVLDAATRPFVLQGRECRIAASIGISIYPDDGRDAQTLLKSADIAMYRVKQQGKNGFRFYSTQMNVHLVERLSMEAGLKRAVERGELFLQYQPRVGVSDGQVRGTEALIRWQHPTQGILGPSEFVPVAEDTGLIAAIGEWTLRVACQQARTWREQGLPSLCMGINLSQKQFLQESLIHVLREAVHQAAVEPSRLELEITEEMVIRNPERAARLLMQFKELGVRVVVDDFGTGYSSLRFLRRLPIDGVKIDRSLIATLANDADAEALARGVVAMAHSLGIEVTAEGVETREQWEFLREIGCEEMQGYYFSPPVSADLVPGIVRRPFVAGRHADAQPLRSRPDGYEA